MLNFINSISIIKDKNYWYKKGEDLVKSMEISTLNYEEALKCYTKALSLDPEFVNGWNAKGYVLYFLGKYEEALKCFDKSLTFDPKNPDSLSNKGLTLYKLGKCEEALKYYNMVLEIAPEYTNAKNNRDKILEKLKGL